MLSPRLSHAPFLRGGSFVFPCPPLPASLFACQALHFASLLCLCPLEFRREREECALSGGAAKGASSFLSGYHLFDTRISKNKGGEGKSGNRGDFPCEHRKKKQKGKTFSVLWILVIVISSFFTNFTVASS